MGLDTTHDAWHGPYSSFNDFRREVLKAYNGEDLFRYEGYESRCKKDNSIESPQKKLSDIDDDGLLILMDHSDCDGEIRWIDCKLVAESINKLIANLPAYYKALAKQFAEGCMKAFEAKENLLFR